jgi:two-component system chemotaxis response regulator CheY
MADKKRVLIADDMEQNRKSIKAFLFFLHFDAILAEDGLAAKKILETEKFDLVVSDIEMPNMNGFELLTFIKRSPVHKDVPVIMLSTLDSPEVQERCRKIGASSYIVKPFTKEKFETALKSIGMAV